MRRFATGFGVLVGGLTGVTVITVAYLGGQLAGFPFFVFDLFEFTTRILPGVVVRTGIGIMVKVITALQIGPLDQTAKLAEKGLALVEFMVIALIFGGVLAIIARRTTRPRIPAVGLAGGAVLFVAMILVEMAQGLWPPGSPIPTIVWLAALFGVWGLALGWLLRELLWSDPSVAGTSYNQARRDLLHLGGSAVIALVAGALGLGYGLRQQATSPAQDSAAVPQPQVTPPTQAIQAATTQPAALLTPAPIPTPVDAPAASALAARIEPAPGTRPELTATKDFYRIDISLDPPQIDAATWKLPITGLVENPLTLTLDEIRARPAISQYVTQSCISNPLGGELISTSLWTGIRLKDLLAEVGLKPSAKELFIKSADYFYESVSQQDMMDERTMLVYAMNGEPLTAPHGFPLRIYIPNHYGMKQPKWITSMEVLDSAGTGYWVDRGWSASAVPMTTSVIDAVDTSATGTTRKVAIGGIAWAGARGISKVEVKVDEGSWTVAQLRTPALSPLTWVQWRYDWPAQPGPHVAFSRTYDGTGTLQIIDDRDTYPDGATGIFDKPFTV